MKFQDSSFNGLKVTVGTKSVTHPPTQARTLQKQYAPSTFSKLGAQKIKNKPTTKTILHCTPCHVSYVCKYTKWLSV